MTKSTDVARLWKTDLPGVELFEAKLYRHRFGKHFHNAYTIGFNESGQGRCLHRRENHTLSPGSFNLINPGEIHTGQVVSSTAGWGFRNIYIGVEQIEEILTQLEWREMPYFKAPVLQEASLLPIFHGLFRALTNGSRLQQQSLLLELLSKLFGLNADPAPTLRPV